MIAPSGYELETTSGTHPEKGLFAWCCCTQFLVSFRAYSVDKKYNGGRDDEGFNK